MGQYTAQPSAFGRLQPSTRCEDERPLHFAYQPFGSSELQWRLL